MAEDIDLAFEASLALRKAFVSLEKRIASLEQDRMADHDRRIKRLEGERPPLPPYEEAAD